MSKELGIIRVVRRVDPFVQVHRETCQDKRLSFKARGLLVYILSLPEDWEIRVAHLAREGKEGREAIRGAFDELEEHGYAQRTRLRKPDGTFAWETSVFEHPGLNDGFGGSTDQEASDGKPSMDQRRETVDGEPSPESRLPREDPRTGDPSSNPAAVAATAPSTAVEKSAERVVAQQVVEQFWESMTPRPVVKGGFIALVKMTEKFIEAGFTSEQMFWALRHTRAYSIDSITFTIKQAVEERAKNEGPSRHTAHNLEALEMLRGGTRRVES